jgi:hypothetical protein
MNMRGPGRFQLTINQPRSTESAPIAGNLGKTNTTNETRKLTANITIESRPAMARITNFLLASKLPPYVNLKKGRV